MNDSWWLRAAVSNTNLVADLLLHLKHSSPPPQPPQPTFLMDPLPTSWGLRHPRSRPSTSCSEKLLDTHTHTHTHTRRSSPTTPLSWSDHSSDINLLPQPSDRLLSKISAASDTPTTSSKKVKRKKSFIQLREEESSLLKERTYLKKELATLQATLNEQRSINENLKRIKLDLQLKSGISAKANIDPEERNTSLNQPCEAASSSISRKLKTEDTRLGVSSQEPVFVLPDLNMAPDEECGLVMMS